MDSLIPTKSAEVVLQLEQREAIKWPSFLQSAACFYQALRNLGREFSLPVKWRLKSAKREKKALLGKNDRHTQCIHLTLTSLGTGSAWGSQHVSRCSFWWAKLHFAIQEVSLRCTYLGTPYLPAFFAAHEAFMLSSLVHHHCIRRAWLAFIKGKKGGFPNNTNCMWH